MLRVLLIEPSATIRHIQKNVLVKHGFDVETATDFAKGLKLIESEANSETNSYGSYDAFVIGWPAILCTDSTKVLEILSTEKYATKAILILAHDDRLGVKERASQSSNTIHIPWCDYKQSGEILASHHKQLTGIAPDTNSPLNQPIRILFVDDSRTVRYKYKTLLAENGYNVDIAHSVESGFNKAINSEFDIAIIDYFMPVENGDVLCKRLLNDPRTNTITSALITGTYIDHAIESSLKSGAVECMFKNESMDLFLARVDAMSRHIRTRKSIEQERKRLGGILHSVGDGVYGVGYDGKISFVNPACMQILGFDKQDSLIGKTAHSLFHYADEDGKPVDSNNSHLQNAYKHGHTITGQQTIFWNKAGEPVPIECTAYPFTVDAQCQGSVVAFRDISERKTLEDKLRWQADHDPLTRLSNRRCFERELGREIDRLKRCKECSALLYIDLDRFKHVNDTAGHAAGDQLLIEISQLLASRLRKSDSLARLGGDEFAIILRGVTEATTVKTAETYKDLLEQYVFSHKDKQYNINGSIGVAIIDHNISSTESALSNADIACHIAKKHGRNQVHFYVPETDKNEDKDLSWSIQINSALDNDLFQLHYQPIYCSKQLTLNLTQKHEETRNINLGQQTPSETQTLEALLRIQDEKQEIIYPNAFLPTAERFNMMDKIDPWVVETAVTHLKDLQQDGYLGKLSLNLSSQTIAEPHIVDIIERIIVESNINATKIVFEISETAAAATSLQARELVYRLNNLGCLVALDDFGSGFFSFTHLKQLDVDFIKINSNLVLGAHNNKYNQAVIKSINDVAHSLNIKTIAKHVEDITTLNFLIESGVDYVQGFFLSEPMVDPVIPFDNNSPNGITSLIG
ncbi:MAG: EAL domain-containing protein [Gammaproteobacteria bacterium]|nr:EAL domain-containing protein [Gammaproteobacteria bacterium]